MLTVSVCVGSACHRRGSYHILTRLQELVKQHGVEGSVSVIPMFCLGHCDSGVTVKVGEKLHLGCSLDSADQLFETAILPQLEGVGA